MKRRNVFAALFAPMLPIAPTLASSATITQNIVVGIDLTRDEITVAILAAKEQAKADILKWQRLGGS